jgi:hypothetical protein
MMMTNLGVTGSFFQNPFSRLYVMLEWGLALSRTEGIKGFARILAREPYMIME